MSEPVIKKKEIFFLFIMIMVIFAVKAKFFHAPLDRDEGAYAYIAQAVFYEDVPYKDVFDHKPPFIYYLYNTAFSLFGESARAVRVFTAWVVVFTAVLLYIFVRTFYPAWAALMAVFLYGLFQHNYLSGGGGSNTEIFAQFPALLAMLFLADREKGYEKVSYFITGFFIAVAAYVNLMAGLLFFVPLLYAAFYEKGEKVRNVSWYLSGFFSVTLLVILWCLKNGCLGDFVESVFFYNIFYTALRESTVPYYFAAKSFFIFFQSKLLLAAGLIYSVVVLFKNPKNKINFVFLLSIIMLFSGVAALKGAYFHYFIIAVPFLCVLAALMLKDMAEWVKKRAGALPAAAALFAVLFTGSVVFAYTTGGVVFTKKRGAAEDVLYEARMAGRYIKSRAKEKEKIFVWPNEPEIYFYSKTKPITKYINAYPFGYYKKDFDKVPGALLRVRPRFIVLRKGPASRVFLGFVKEYYSRVMATNNLEIYEKKPDNYVKD